LIAFINSDDLWASSKLSLQVDYLARHPEVQFLIAGIPSGIESRIERHAVCASL